MTRDEKAVLAALVAFVIILTPDDVLGAILKRLKEGK